MDIKRLRELSGMPANDAFVFESKMTPEQEIAALEAQYKADPDPRSRSTLAAMIKTAKSKLAGSKTAK